MGWGLDSPGNQPSGNYPDFWAGPKKKERTKCINHSRRNAVALWGRQLEPVCLNCLEECVVRLRKIRNS